MIYLLIIAIAIGITSILFLVQNVSPAPVTFIFWNTDIPIALIVLISFIVGILITLVFCIVYARKLKRIIESQKKQTNELEDELQTFKSTLSEIQNNPAYIPRNPRA
jgi:putative membrane protein